MPGSHTEKPTQPILERLRRYAGVRQNQQRIARLARQVAAHAPSGRQAPVVLFNPTTRLGGFTLNAAFGLLTSWSLRLAGIPVVHFVCQAGMTHCVLGTNSNDPGKPPPCQACIAQSRRLHAQAQAVWFGYQEHSSLAAALQGLTVEQLGCFEFPSPAFPVDTAWIPGPDQPGAPTGETNIPLGRLVLPSARWALRRHHLLDDAPTRRLLKEYILSAYSLAEQFTRFLLEHKPASAIFFNGILYPEATARWIAQQVGLSTVAYEVGFQPYSVFFSHAEPTAYPIDIPPSFELNPDQAARLEAHLEKRFQGKFSMAGIRFWPEMRGLEPAFLEKAASFRQVVPIFTNVVYDSSQVHANTIFSNMFEWLDLLLPIIQDHPETLFVIRAHPDEKRPVSNKVSNESVHDWISARGVAVLPNVVFIEPDEFISSYELIERSKFVLVYNSSIGLEAALLGAPVICGGKARYTQYPTVFLPESQLDFQSMVEDFLNAEVIHPPAEFQNNARRFLYYQFYRISLSMDGFLTEGEKPGAVYLKPFSWQHLLPENSDSLRTIHEGLLFGKPFQRTDP